MDRFLIVGLGNPGRKYEKTRHNIGFRILEALANKNGLEFTEKKKFLGKVAEGDVLGSQATLLMPETYMNLSGKAVRSLSEYYKIPHSKILVVVDDIDLEFGALRLKINSGPGTHNGLKSVELELNSQRYTRLKVGVGSSFLGNLSDYVLSPFTNEEEEALPRIITKALESIEIWMKEGITRAMESTNRKRPSNPSNGE